MNSSFKMNKNIIAIHKLGEEPKSHIFWLSQPPEKRLDAIEFLRKQTNGSESRIQRVYRITKLTQS